MLRSALRIAAFSRHCATASSECGQPGPCVQINVMVAIVLGGFHSGRRCKRELPAAIVGALMVTILTNGLASLWASTPEWGNFAKAGDAVSDCSGAPPP